jgi:hypothetical protein
MPEKRIHCSVTMNIDLYEAVKAAAKTADQPLTVWCREALKLALQKANGLERDFSQTS